MALFKWTYIVESADQADLQSVLNNYGLTGYELVNCIRRPGSTMWDYVLKKQGISLI